IAALGLEAEAFAHAARALALTRDDSDAVPSAYVKRLARERRLAISTRDLTDAEPALAADTALAFDTLSPESARRVRIALERIVSRVLAELEWRSPETIRRLRTNRLFMVLTLVVLTASLAIRAFRVTSNVALYKAAEASEVSDNSQAALTD